ncbi:phosphate ABC transporter permease PstA [Vibrio sp. SS-MA-C1-2]|uniref:phosphate ABC transporter permease PstA n=1 Tax=Vibrio sp. SS-MA-C1-2 TaxID=2908646 RepID=UPI001F2040DD|nr:phosphate ABC transporter permease PstA [Vibrio sp. SS-MA-C1-2]UJF20067.1 phosphate ABC transporter permease PstA [Vibrio sp. SS-MA-C1-2]
MIKWFRSGDPWIWLTAGMISTSLIAVFGLLLLIATKGLSYFWPADIYQITVDQQGQSKQIVGEIFKRQDISKQRLLEAGYSVENIKGLEDQRLLIRIGHRELSSINFDVILQSEIQKQTQPKDIATITRTKNGPVYAFPETVTHQGESVTVENIEQQVASKIALYQEYRQQYRQLVAENRTHMSPELIRQLTDIKAKMKQDSLIVQDINGQTIKLPFSEILDFWYPNQLSLFGKLSIWGHQLIHFLVDNPREANTEGGVFPAIFGTVFMVILMSIIVMPLGVLAAVYLHEYAKDNTFTRIIRISVVNLAGVPSIVYGIFGLGFFVYTIGGTMDQLFYSEQLPAPTFGTPGILWSALTLAILTLPVVIVTTEEGLTRIPSAIRYGSLALGATKAETLWRIVLPMATPAMMTGLILAIARAAGEVAPLMLVGAVKMAPTLPVDSTFPFVHLDRKFMHLGSHIYDVGFQSPNVESARPLVYATSLLLITVVVGLNLTAIMIRSKLRDRFQLYS